MIVVQNSALNDCINGIAAMIRTPTIAHGIFCNAHHALVGYADPATWPAWDAIQHDIMPGWTGLLHATALAHQLEKRLREHIRLAKTRPDIEREAQFGSGMLLLAALHQTYLGRVRILRREREEQVAARKQVVVATAVESEPAA
jgi:hypothetical protein